MIGLMVDLHGTLLDSNYAWSKAFQKFDPKRMDYYSHALCNKVSRKELANIAGVPFEQIKAEYRKNLRPREEILAIVNILKKSFELVIVTNSKRNDALLDLEYLPNLNYKAIFTKEDGCKPDMEYLNSIIEQLNWEFAYLIGNDICEDCVDMKNVCSILVPDYPRD